MMMKQNKNKLKKKNNINFINFIQKKKNYKKQKDFLTIKMMKVSMLLK